MCLLCSCPLGIHRPGCPLGGSGGGSITITPGTEPGPPAPPARVGWRCGGCGAQVSPDERTCPRCSPQAPVFVPPPFTLEPSGTPEGPSFERFTVTMAPEADDDLGVRSNCVAQALG